MLIFTVGQLPPFPPLFWRHCLQGILRHNIEHIIYQIIKLISITIMTFHLLVVHIFISYNEVY